ncbi:MAG: hypothetical protein CML56_10115 [Rhodobacteraceae bacterium]|nr:hypothetical protein [Paracoccaceae bacterium]
MDEMNVLVIMTDELRRDILGCYGNKLVQTPNIDALVGKGVKFENAYTPSPICVPARASMATGQYVHEHRCWANAIPYHGQIESWHHRLRNAGRRCTAIGKLHFRGTADDNGFTEEIKPLHVKDGKGWVHGLLRERTDLFDASSFAQNIGPGEDPYTDYDRAVCRQTLDWLEHRAADKGSAGWGAFVSFLRPHYPLTCPPEYYSLYCQQLLPPPKEPLSGSGKEHPVLKNLRLSCDYEAAFSKEDKQIAIASYYGLCSFVDDMVGKIITKLHDTGLDKNTIVIFSSDHGECLGDRGFWTKMVMYEEAACVPLIMAGPDIGTHEEQTPVSLIDLYPTILNVIGLEHLTDEAVHAKSLFETINQPDTERPILSEFHDYGAQTGMFMLRHKDWKLIHYPGFEPQLFNLKTDAEEEHNLANKSEYAVKLNELMSLLKTISDPDAVNEIAFADQEDMISKLGGSEAILATQNYDHTPIKEI